jgi:hypothetical protein
MGLLDGGWRDGMRMYFYTSLFRAFETPSLLYITRTQDAEPVRRLSKFTPRPVQGVESITSPSRASIWQGAHVESGLSSLVMGARRAVVQPSPPDFFQNKGCID